MQAHHPPGRTSRLLVFAIAGLALVACQRPGSGNEGPPDAGPLLIGPENTTRVKQEAIQAGPRISGSLEPREQARVRAEVGGSVTAVEVELGEQVKKGQLLGRIEDAALRNAYASAQSAVRAAEQEVDNAKRQAERTQKLVTGGALAERDLEMAQSARASAEARVAQARAQLAQVQQQLGAATLKSPIDGVVSEKAVNQGDVVAPGAPLFTVIDPSTMRLQASVPSESLASLEVGTTVDFQVRGYPDQTFTGKIEQIAPAADPVTRQITTLISIPNPGGKLIAGLFAEGRVAAQTRETLVVPLAAIDVSSQNPSVTRVKNGVAEKVPVTLGLRDPQTERVEVQGPVEAGDVLLTGAAMAVSTGTPVKLTGASVEASK